MDITAVLSHRSHVLDGVFQTQGLKLKITEVRTLEDMINQQQRIYANIDVAMFIVPIDCYDQADEQGRPLVRSVQIQLNDDGC